MLEEIAQQLKKLIKRETDSQWLFLAKVTAVDVDKQVCDVQPVDGGSALLDVRLKAVNDEAQTGFVIFPKIGSIVLLAAISDEDAFVLSCQEVEQIKVWGKVIFNDGNNAGLIVIDKLKTQIDKNSAILNAVMQILRGTPINEPGSGSPSALQAALNIAVQGKTTADLSNVTNEDVKH